LFAKGRQEEDILLYKKMQKEIAQLDSNQDRKINFHFKERFPILHFTLTTTSDPEGALAIIWAAKEYGINLHGGGLTFTQNLERSRIIMENLKALELGLEGKDQVKANLKDLNLDILKKINHNSYAVIKELIKQNKKVITYNGGHHNNTTGGLLEYSFGDELIKEVRRYIEIDLVNPAYPMGDEYDMSFAKYLSFAPEEGVRMVKDKDKIVIVFAKKDGNFRVNEVVDNPEIVDLAKKFYEEVKRNITLNPQNVVIVTKDLKQKDTYIIDMYEIDIKAIKRLLTKFAKNYPQYRFSLEEFRVEDLWGSTLKIELKNDSTPSGNSHKTKEESTTEEERQRTSVTIPQKLDEETLQSRLSKENRQKGNPSVNKEEILPPGEAEVERKRLTVKPKKVVPEEEKKKVVVLPEAKEAPEKIKKEAKSKKLMPPARPEIKKEEPQIQEESPVKRMPIIWERFKAYDIDGTPGLSPMEIELMNSSDGSYLFEYSVKDGEISIEDAYNILKDISISKISRILVGIMDSEIRSQYFVKIASEDLNRAVSIVMNIKESPFEIGLTYEGFEAYLLLKGLNQDLKREILLKVEKLDPAYFKNILAQEELIQAWGKRESIPPLPSSESIPTQKTTHTRKHTIDTPSSREILQHEYAISEEKLLQTFGIGPCVAVTLYDPIAKIGMLAHFDTLTEVYDSLDQILLELKLFGASQNRIEARIIGGLTGSSEELIYEIKDRLNEAGISIVEEDILGVGEARAIQFNTLTGEISDYEETINTTSNLDEKIKRIPKKKSRLFRSEHSILPYPISHKEGQKTDNRSPGKPGDNAGSSRGKFNHSSRPVFTPAEQTLAVLDNKSGSYKPSEITPKAGRSPPREEIISSRQPRINLTNPILSLLSSLGKFILNLLPTPLYAKEVGVSEAKLEKVLSLLRDLSKPLSVKEKALQDLLKLIPQITKYSFNENLKDDSLHINQIIAY
jgi:chemotaxis receptor (MCP) glutamine deamidase CheD